MPVHGKSNGAYAVKCSHVPPEQMYAMIHPSIRMPCQCVLLTEVSFWRWGEILH